MLNNGTVPEETLIPLDPGLSQEGDVSVAKFWINSQAI